MMVNSIKILIYLHLENDIFKHSRQAICAFSITISDSKTE